MVRMKCEHEVMEYVGRGCEIYSLMMVVVVRFNRLGSQGGTLFSVVCFLRVQYVPM
jgi:hypothetical protein